MKRFLLAALIAALPAVALAEVVEILDSAQVQHPASPSNPVPTQAQAGTAIMGKVGIDQTAPGTTNGVQVNAALPSGTNNIGLTTQAAATAQLTHASVSQNVAASTNVVGAVAGKSIKVYELVLSAAAATTVQLFDGATALTGVMSLATGTPLVIPFTGEPHMSTSTAAALNLALGGAVQVSGYVRYIQN